MMYQYLLALLTCLSVSYTSFSQNKNTVKLHSSGFYFPGYNQILNHYARKKVTSIAGISYERGFKKHYGIGMQYSFWRGPAILIHNNYLDDPESIGKIISSYNYKSFNVFAAWHADIAKNIKIGLQAGPSISQVENEYLRSLTFYSTDPGLGCGTFTSELVTDTYLGGVANLSFDYLFYKNRIPFGVDLGARHYRNFPFQYNYGLHLGFNF